MHPPLSESVVSIIRDLWPSAVWSQGLRQNWRERLGGIPEEQVVTCVKEHHMRSRSKSPCLADVLSIYRVKFGSMGDALKWKTTMPTTEDLEKDLIRMTEYLQNLPPKKLEECLTRYYSLRKKSRTSSIEEMSRNQVGMLYAIASITR